MPRNGSGTYSLPAGNPVVTGTTISSTVQNTTMTDVQNALTTSIASDGQTTPTANLPMGGFKHTGQGAGTIAGDSVRWEQLFSQGAEQTLASAATTDIGTQNTSFLQITGTTTITSFGVNYNGPRWLRFAASLAIVNSATLICPVPGSNLNVAAGDVVVARPISGGGWIVDLIMSPAQLIAQRWLAFTTAGTAPAFTLAPTIPLLSYVAGQRFSVTFNAAGTTGSNTINVSGLGAQNLKQYLSTGVKTPAVIASGMVSDIQYDGTDFIVLDPLSAPVLKNYLTGCTLSTAGASTTISISAGQLTDAGNSITMNLAASISKTTAAWSVGTATGGLDTGSIAASTWYYFYIIRRTDTGVVDVVFSLSSSAPTLPANYTQYRYIGGAATNGSSQWVKFIQVGDEFTWDVAVTDANGAGVIAYNLLTCSVPRGRKLKVLFELGSNNSTSQGCKLLDPDTSSAISSYSSGIVVAGGTDFYSQASCFTNTAAQIRHIEQSTNNITIVTIGWVDTRDRLI